MKVKNKKIGVMYSGGKDSTFSLGRLLEQGYDVVCLITMISENQESYMLHTQDIEMTKLSSEALDIPLVLGHTEGRKEEELKDIKETILVARDRFGIEGIGTGAIASRYQKTRIESIASSCGLSVLSPIWGMKQSEYMRTLVLRFYRFILTSVSCQGLDETWLGRELTIADIEKLEQLSSRYRFNIAFEGGEGETFVLDCPLFAHKRVRILDSKIEWNGYIGSFEIKQAILEDKPVYDKRV
jgi:diphthine-ammonia ligase